MPSCPHCRTKYRPDAKFCAHCGAAIEKYWLFKLLFLTAVILLLSLAFLLALIGLAARYG